MYRMDVFITIAKQVILKYSFNSHDPSQQFFIQKYIFSLLQKFERICWENQLNYESSNNDGN